MVASTVIIRVLTTLASLTALTVNASPIESGSDKDLSRRDDSTDYNTLIGNGLDDPKYYHFDEYPGIKDENKTKQKMIKQQPLSLAKGWLGVGEKGDQGNYDFFWFAEKNPVYKNDGPGKGCEVSLYFENIVERAKAAKSQLYNHDRYSDRSELTWAVPSAMTPRCNPDIVFDENTSFMQNKNYPPDAVGFISARPDDEEYYKSAIVTLGYLDGEGNGDADTTKAKSFNTKFVGKGVEHILNAEYEEFIEKFNELIKKDYTKIPNPYKFGKADVAKWAKKKDANFYVIPKAKQ